MQFRNFTWPTEPSSLRVTSRRRTALLEEPGGGWTLQDLGTAARTVTGEGVFFGETAYESLRTLEAHLAQGGAGALAPQNVEIPDGSLAFGSPAKIKGQLDEAAIAELRQAALDYQKEAMAYKAEQEQ